MATHRDEVRAARNTLNQRAKELGVDMEAERSKTDQNERTLTFEALKLINSQTPRINREKQQIDNPPSGAFNGGNTAFALTAAVVGENITVVWHDRVNNIQWVLTKSNANPPATHEFFFDNSDPSNIVVGDPPNPGDGLVAVYMVKR